MDTTEERLNNTILAMSLLQLGASNNQKDIAELKASLNTLRDDRIRGMERIITVSEERVDRLQKVVYGVCAIAVGQMITFIVGIVLWIIKK